MVFTHLLQTLVSLLGPLSDAEAQPSDEAYTSRVVERAKIKTCPASLALETLQ
jgi:hypothetical protein